MGDEVTLVAGFAGQGPQAGFPGSQRTQPSGPFDHDGPRHRGQVCPRKPMPSNGEEATENDEQDEQQVQHDQEVGQHRIERRQGSAQLCCTSV